MTTFDHPIKTAQWWKNAVVYQVYPASFADSDGDGMGDLPGITGHLDDIAALGVDVVWLSPIFVTPWDDGGYDISDYLDIDPRFGTIADFDALLAGVHARGMKLILDLVPNHTSDEHSWFVESRSSTDNPKRDWYYWRPPRAGHELGRGPGQDPGPEPGTPGTEPTNWRSEFHQSAWQYDPLTGEYYLHLYSSKQPDLNWENPEVRNAIYAVMRWWLNRGVDGFRMDVINKISKVLPFTDAPAEPGERFMNARDHYVNGPRVHEFLQEMNAEALAPYGDRLLTVGETSGVTMEHARLFTDPARHELNMVFTFEHVRIDQGRNTFDILPLDLPKLKQIMARWQVQLSEVGGWNSLYWCNHDQPRAVSRWGDDGAFRVEAAKMLATVLHFHQGTPYVYQGEEIGMTNQRFDSLDDFQDVASIAYSREQLALGADPDSLLAALHMMSRDNARSPMQWDTSPSAGFSSGAPWQPVNPNYETVNVRAAVQDLDSVWHHYRRLIEFRHTLPVVSNGDFTLLLPDHQHIYAFNRRLGDVTLLVLGNFSGETQSVDIPGATEWASAELLIGSHRVAAGAQLVLQPWESRVYRAFESPDIGY